MQPGTPQYLILFLNVLERAKIPSCLIYSYVCSSKLPVIALVQGSRWLSSFNDGMQSAVRT
jgi:hypothetical protein